MRWRFVVAGAGLALALVILFCNRDTRKGRDAGAGRVAAARKPETPTSRTIPVDRDENDATTAEREPVRASHDDLPEAPAPGFPGTEVFTNLKAAVAASTYERLDPNAILEAASLVLDWELSGQAIPEFSESGEIVLPFVNTPPGISAKLTVGDSSAYDAVVGLDITFDEPAEPDFLDGVLRNEAICMVRVYSNGGEMSVLGISTNYEPHYKRMLDQGLPFDRGTIVHGTSCTIRADPSEPMRMKATGLQDGKMTNWIVPVTLDGGPLRRDLVRSFSDRLLDLHKDLKTRKNRK